MGQPHVGTGEEASLDENQQNGPQLEEGEILNRVTEAMRSSFVMFTPALYLVNFPEAVSNDKSTPAANFFVPRTVAKLTIGLAASPKLVLTPA